VNVGNSLDLTPRPMFTPDQRALPTTLAKYDNFHCDTTAVMNKKPHVPLGMITPKKTTTQDAEASVENKVLAPKEKASLRVKLLLPEAKIPVQGSKGAIGYDLYAMDDHNLNPGTRLVIPVGIAIATPPGTYGRIAPRSSLSAKYSIDLGAGVIDPDYRGEIKVLLINNGESLY